VHTIPVEVHEGMPVFDRSKHRIGRVASFRFSENATAPAVEPAELEATDRVVPDSLMGEIAQAFAADGVPEEVHERLIRDGYVKLDTSGLFAADRYVLPGQIASASKDALFLSVDLDDLMKQR